MLALKRGRAIARTNINFSVWLSDLPKSLDMHPFFAKYDYAYLLLIKNFLDASRYNSTNILIWASIWGKRHFSVSKLLPYKKKGFQGILCSLNTRVLQNVPRSRFRYPDICSSISQRCSLTQTSVFQYNAELLYILWMPTTFSFFN